MSRVSFAIVCAGGLPHVRCGPRRHCVMHFAYPALPRYLLSYAGMGNTLPPMTLPPPSRGPGTTNVNANDANAPQLLPPHLRGPVDPMAAHTEVQRAVLKLLVEVGVRLAIPVRPDILLQQITERYPEVAAVAHALHPDNVGRALHELQEHVPVALRVERGVLTGLDPLIITDFHARLTGGAPTSGLRPNGGGGGGGPAAGGGGGGGNVGGTQLPQGGGGGAGAVASGASGGSDADGKKKRSATAVYDDELMEVLDLVDKKSIKQQEKQGATDELLDLLSAKSAKQRKGTEQFRNVSTSNFKVHLSSAPLLPSPEHLLTTRPLPSCPTSRSFAGAAQRSTARVSTAGASPATTSTSDASSARTPT